MKKFLSLFLTAVMLMSFMCIGVSAEEDYTVVSPYADVIWSGDGEWGAYKGNLHTHSFVSDGNVDYRDMIEEYYKQGYDFLAMTDHAITDQGWNKNPVRIPLYLYQQIIGNRIHWFTDDEFAVLQDGTYPVDGQPRGYGMTCVTGGNELNGLTITKCHVNGIFLPGRTGVNHLGYENDHEGAVKLVDESETGLSFINHPGDWLHSNKNHDIVSDPESVKYFGDIILSYDSCLGMEVFNEKNSVTPCDRVLWDNLLMYCLPYGKTVIAFSNSDAHTLDLVDSSFCVFMMEENNEENVRKTMQSGAFFAVTRMLPADDVLGPKEDMRVNNSGLPYPEFTEVSVDGHKITVKGKECNNIQFVADGKVIASKDLVQSAEETSYTLDLDTVNGAENFKYVRCQLIGEGGVTLTQALVIDNGTEPMQFVKDTSVKAKFDSFLNRIKSLRLIVLFEVIIDKIADKIKG